MRIQPTYYYKLFMELAKVGWLDVTKEYLLPEWWMETPPTQMVKSLLFPWILCCHHVAWINSLLFIILPLFFSLLSVYFWVWIRFLCTLQQHCMVFYSVVMFVCGVVNEKDSPLGIVSLMMYSNTHWKGLTAVTSYNQMPESLGKKLLVVVKNPDFLPLLGTILS